MDWIAFVIGLVGLYYNGRKVAVCWLIFSGSRFCWLVHWSSTAPHLHEVEFAAVLMSLVTMGLYARNYLTWRRDDHANRVAADAMKVAAHSGA